MGKLELKTKLWIITPEDAEENIPSDMTEQGLRSIWRVRPRRWSDQRASARAGHRRR